MNDSLTINLGVKCVYIYSFDMEITCHVGKKINQL